MTIRIPTGDTSAPFRVGDPVWVRRIVGERNRGPVVTLQFLAIYEGEDGKWCVDPIHTEVVPFNTPWLRLSPNGVIGKVLARWEEDEVTAGFTW